MTQNEIDQEMALLEPRIGELKLEIETAQSIHAEAPNKSEFFDMMHGDEISDLTAKLERLQKRYSDLEMMVADEDEQQEIPPRHLYLPVERRAARSIV